MTTTRWTIGVDLGGTNLRAGLVGPGGGIRVRDAMSLGEDKSSSAIIASIARLVENLRRQAKDPVVAVGCGVPGIVDACHGIVSRSPNLPAWNEVPVREALMGAIGLPLVVDNDANMHALGEACCGSGVGHTNVVMLTLGSGIGGGIVLEGKVFHGDQGYAGEVGHLVVEPDGEPCGCGGRGCWERYAASRAFALFANRLPPRERSDLLAAAGTTIERLTPEVVADLADRKNEVAIGLWREFGRYLGIGIATLLNVLGVTTFIIGGGISRSFDRFAGAARESALSHTYACHVSRLLLLRAALGDDAGIIGAANAAADSVS